MSDQMSFQALVVRKQDGQYVSAVETRQVADLPAGDLLVQVEYSSLNYKDALSASGNPGVTRSYPHTPGIDAAGTVLEAGGGFAEGDRVIVIGYDLGMNTAGGFGGCIRVPSAWAMPLPEGMSALAAMQFGTAGLTAGLCVQRLLDAGVSLDGAAIAVTGATGGVGCLSVALLAKLGAEVTAVSGKPDAQAFLGELGAAQVISREELAQEGRPLQKTVWDGAVDVAGGWPLANLVAQLKPDAAVACCGLVADAALPVTVLPFILRGVSLLGVDSVEIPLARKQRIFESLAGAWSLPQLGSLCREVSLAQLPDEIDTILAGGQRGRVVVAL